MADKEVKVTIKVDEQPSGAIKKIDSDAKGLSGTLNNLKGIFLSFISIDFLKNILKTADENKKIMLALEQALTLTGNAAGLTAKQMDNLAKSISAKTAIDDDAIKSAETMLVSFGKINDSLTFEKALKATADLDAMMTKGNSTIETMAATSKAVALAMQDPEQGMFKLRRAGILLDDQQKEYIKTLQNTGKVQEAQLFILDQIEKKVGGQAEALATPINKIKNYWDQLTDAIAEVAQTVLEFVAPAIFKLIDAFMGLPSWIKTTVTIATTLVIGLGALGTGLAGIAIILPSVIAGFSALSVAVSASSGVIGITAIAITSLITAFALFNSTVKKPLEQQNLKELQDNITKTDAELQKAKATLKEIDELLKTSTGANKAQLETTKKNWEDATKNLKETLKKQAEAYKNLENKIISGNTSINNSNNNKSQQEINKINDVILKLNEKRLLEIKTYDTVLEKLSIYKAQYPLMSAEIDNLIAKTTEEKEKVTANYDELIKKSTALKTVQVDTSQAIVDVNTSASNMSLIATKNLNDIEKGITNIGKAGDKTALLMTKIGDAFKSAFDTGEYGKAIKNFLRGELIAWGAVEVSKAVMTGIAAAIPTAGASLAVAAGEVGAIIAQVELGKAALDAVPFADGGVVGGTSFTGDKIPARVNSGEVILNNKQQASLLFALSNRPALAQSNNNDSIQTLKNIEKLLMSGQEVRLTADGVGNLAKAIYYKNTEQQRNGQISRRV